MAFEEAVTVFEDYLSVTIADIMHSDDEECLITIGVSSRNRILVVIHTEQGEWIRIISARVATQHERRQYEHKHKPEIEDDDMLPEYDFSNGVRGKYAERLAQLKQAKATTIVLDPDVASYFHDSESVNHALRVLIKVAHQEVLLPA